MNISSFDDFCVGPFMNLTQLLDNSWPQFTPCFIHTILVWLPCGYVWILLPYFLYDVNNELSTNNLDTTTAIPRKPSIKRQDSHSATANGGPRMVNLKAQLVPVSAICLTKMMATCLLAVLTLVTLIIDIRYHRPLSQLIGSSIYLITYVLVVFQLRYERYKGRNPLFISFYFYAMNVVFGAVPLYSWILTEEFRSFKAEYATIAITELLNLLCVILSIKSDSVVKTDKRGYNLKGEHVCPEVLASYPSQILFTWMLKLMLTGFRREITAEDVWEMNPRDQGCRLNPLFEKYWNEEVKRVTNINNSYFPKIELNTWIPITQTNGNKHKMPTRLSLVSYDGTNERTSLLFAEESKISGAEVPSPEKVLTTPSLLRVLFRLVWKNALTATLQKVVADFFLYMGPSLLGVLIQLLQNPEKDRVWKAYIVSFGLVVCGMMKALLFAHSMYRSSVIGIHMKTTLVAAIYRKALTVSSSAKKGSTIGEIVNLMSVDCQRLQEIMTIFFFMWTTPLQILIAVVFLYLTIGPSVLTGVGLLLLMVPINTWIGSKQKLIQEAVLKIKDNRIKMVNEILNGMKVLKLYAWEDEFKNKVELIRQKEVHELYRIALLYVLSGMFWGLAPFLVGLVTFATYVLSDRNNVLDPQKAFVSLALFNLLKVPLNYISTIIIYTVQVYVSIKRINTFLITPDLDTSNTIWDSHAKHAISVKRGTFSWDLDFGATLKNINLTIPVGQLTAVVGPVGAGKSSLIQAFLGEMEKLSGEVVMKGTVAYVSQQAWIQNATVRDNILFGKKFLKQRYQQVIKACELERDLEILEAGDQTEIGEKGINLSGGQKQRVNLARAVYSNSDVYLFDDPLSAVDAHVGKAIFKNVVGPRGVLSKKTRVLVTHGVHWLPQVDKIIVMSNGTISEHGSYEELMTHNGVFAQFLQVYLLKSEPTTFNEDGMNSDEDEEIRVVKENMKTAVDRVTSDAGNTSAEEFNYFTKPVKQDNKGNRVRSASTLSQPFIIHESLDLSLTMTGMEKSIHREGGKLILEEKLETGKVKREVFVVYGRAAGLWAMAIAFLSYLINQGFIVWSSFWLTQWTEDSILLNDSTRQSPGGIAATNYYLTVYGAFFGTAQVFTFVLFNYLFWYRLVRAAERLHHLLLDRLLHAPMSFFDQTPIGRILNRFSKDVDTVDNTLPLILRDWLVTASLIVFTLIVVLIQTPIFGAVLVPMVIIFVIIQNYYVRASRQLKRIESIARSPVYAHFSESVTGAAVIRAYRAKERFSSESEKRVDKNQVYYFASQAAIRWLQLNMDSLANLVVLFAAIFQIIAGGGGSDAGLAVSYALQVSGALPYMVRQICEFETNIVSVERMKEYSQVEQEAELINPRKRPAPFWPATGDVTFNNYQSRYREGLDLVLKGVDCKIFGGEKVGIVGRTGAGKSSLTLSLFRIIEAVSGAIIIDGINIADIGLHDLRSKLTILPQDPVLFSGSLRMNIDPFNQYTDYQLWKALERSHLKDFVAGQREKLMYECGEEGSNLSVGQRQLVCLARSLLRHTKILILDEATAAIDMETDSLIQSTIREAFRDCTIIAIAHRLNTIMDYDRIIVIDAGIIKEFDSPKALIENKGVFYHMCRDAGLV
ncbi:unnamed protein product [Lymnaea stagnalis]|uniref:ABC-type glutathione-S-conjugate transporter n=1 Tax=Lymnaea stagnalis TaxID=6523 RepID=A0AAV2H1Q1_LYMST